MEIPVYENGVQVGTMELPDTRPVVESLDSNGRLTAFHRVYESAAGVITFRLLGEVPARLHASCPLAPTQDTKCTSSAVLPPIDITSQASIGAASAAVAKEMGIIAQTLADGHCPIHNPVTAPLTIHDQVLLSMTEAQVRALVAQNTPTS